MNRKGELEYAHAHARIGAELHRLLGELRRHAGHETGEITVDGKYTPLLDTVFSRAKLSRSAGYRALADAQRLGWFTRYDTANPAKIAGLLDIGQDDADIRERECECGCGRPLTGLRPDARYHSTACRMRAARSRKASRPVPTSVTGSVPTSVTASPDIRNSASPDIRNGVTDDPSHRYGSSVTLSPDIRNNSQVRVPDSSGDIHKRAQGRDLTENEAENFSPAGTRRAVPPDGWMLRRIPQIVADWAPGISRPDLADALGVSEFDGAFHTSLMVLYRRRRIDFCADYVVTQPANPGLSAPPRPASPGEPDEADEPDDGPEPLF